MLSGIEKADLQERKAAAGTHQESEKTEPYSS
jgi:hypothetical protein